MKGEEVPKGAISGQGMLRILREEIDEDQGFKETIKKSQGLGVSLRRDETDTARPTGDVEIADTTAIPQKRKGEPTRSSTG